MALSAAACAEKYSINDCGANIAIASQKLNAPAGFNRASQQPAIICTVTCRYLPQFVRPVIPGYICGWPELIARRRMKSSAPMGCELYIGSRNAGAPARKSLVPFQERRKGRPGNASARRHGSRISLGLQGRNPFIGEDNIQHTPKDETLKIYVGDAFDVVCERKQTDYKKLASNLYELEFEITLRNHKDAPVTVEVREPVGGDWEIVNSNFTPAKLDARFAGFQVRSLKMELQS